MATDIPGRSADAAHVRRFITDVLVSDYYTDPNFASETARAWRIGRGSELHDAKQKYFEDLFGAEIGFCLYRSVLEARDKTWQDSRIGVLITWGVFLSPLLSFWTLYQNRPASSDTPLFTLLIHGALLMGNACLRPKGSYISLVMGLVSFGAYVLLWSRRVMYTC